MSDTRRITLLARGHATPDRDWSRFANESTRLVTIESLTVLRYTLSHAVADIDLDIERVILDRSFSPAEYLDLLAALPAEFGADVMLIRNDESGYLSASGRGAIAPSIRCGRTTSASTSKRTTWSRDASRFGNE